MEYLIPSVVIATFGLFVLLERLFPARPFPRVPLWGPKGVLFLGSGLALSTYAPLLWDGWLGAHRLFDGSGLGTWGGAVVGFFLVQAGVFVWHRALHAVDGLWRIHQMHHSAERLDALGAFYFHPLDVVGFSLVSSLALVLVVGVNAEAAMLVAGVSSFLSIFQHSNLRTPRWLGYVVQRPESHGVHHQRGLHGFNYGDLPIFDLLFGTFRNPPVWDGKAGLVDGGSRRLGDLLLGRDITRAPVADPAAPARAR